MLPIYLLLMAIAAEDRPTVDEAIVVTATRHERPLDRAPRAVDVLGPDEIGRDEIGISLEEALRAVPGVVASDRHNPSLGDRLAIRGIGARAAFGVRGAQVVLDDVPLTLADGQSALDGIDLGAAGTIEVLRGPTSSLYGNAAGGVLEIRTTRPAGDAPRVEPGIVTGSYGLKRWQAGASGGGDRHSYFVHASGLDRDGFREHAAARTRGIHAVTRHDLSARVGLTTVLNVFDAPYLLGPGSLDKEDAAASPTLARPFVVAQGSGKSIRQGQAGVTFRYERDPVRLRATLYGLSRRLFNAIPGRVIDLDRDAGGLRAVVDGPWRDARVRWTAGLDVALQNDARSEFENLGVPGGAAEPGTVLDLVRRGDVLVRQDESVLGVGPFVALELAASPRWSVTLGVRYDRHRFSAVDRHLADGRDDGGSRTMDAFSPTAGVAWAPRPSVTLYANYATAFATPTTTELGNRPGGDGGFNPGLEPERLRSLEIGVRNRRSRARVRYSAALYRLTVDDMLIPFQSTVAGSEEIFFRNAGRTRNLGAEARVDWSPLRDLVATVSYTRSRFTFEDFVVEHDAGSGPAPFQLAGRRVPGVPPQQWFAGLVWERDRGPRIEADARRVERTYANDFNGPPPGSPGSRADFVNEGYVVASLRAGFPLARERGVTRLFFGIDNLFDRRYNGSIVPNAAGDRFFEPAPGRAWYAGVRVSLGPSRKTVEPASFSRLDTVPGSGGDTVVRR